MSVSRGEPHGAPRLLEAGFDVDHDRPVWAVPDRGHVDIRQANQQPRSSPKSRQSRDNPARSEAH